MAHMMLANALAALRMHSEAVAAAAVALSAGSAARAAAKSGKPVRPDDDAPPPDDAAFARMYHMQGKSYMMLGNLERANAAFLSGLARDAGNVALLSDLLEAKLRLRDRIGKSFSIAGTVLYAIFR